MRSDGCTGFPDGYWRECCVMHDKAYEAGGTREWRLYVDRCFWRCIWEKVYVHTGKEWRADIQARLMYYGVRVFGSPWCLPLYLWPHWRKRARWGYGKEGVR